MPKFEMSLVVHDCERAVLLNASRCDLVLKFGHICDCVREVLLVGCDVRSVSSARQFGFVKFLSKLVVGGIIAVGVEEKVLGIDDSNLAECLGLYDRCCVFVVLRVGDRVCVRSRLRHGRLRWGWCIAAGALILWWWCR